MADNGRVCGGRALEGARAPLTDSLRPMFRVRRAVMGSATSSAVWPVGAPGLCSGSPHQAGRKRSSPQSDRIWSGISDAGRQYPDDSIRIFGVWARPELGSAAHRPGRVGVSEGGPPRRTHPHPARRVLRKQPLGRVISAPAVSAPDPSHCAGQLAAARTVRLLRRRSVGHADTGWLAQCTCLGGTQPAADRKTV